MEDATIITFTGWPVGYSCQEFADHGLQEQHSDGDSNIHMENTASCYDHSIVCGCNLPVTLSQSLS